MAARPSSVIGSIWGHGHNETALVATDQAQYLTDEEISRFLDDLDHNGDGMIDYDEVEQKLDAVHDELIPQPRAHNILARKRSQLMRRNNHHRHEFLRSIIGSDARRIPREEFAKRVKEWNIPSLELNGRESNRDYVRKMSLFRRIRAYWAVHGPEIAFLVLVVGLQLAFGIWQLVKYTREQYEDAFGWGIGMAKAFAGALYPTMFFLIISMSRYVSTFLRRSYWLGRFINWDLSQSFHVKISIVALVFSTLHTIGHLTGTFRIATEEDRGDDVASLLGDAAPPGGGKLLYHHFVVSVPGITGIIALVLFYLLALLSMPVVRRWNYEVFQLGHLLMYPIIGFLIAHGSAALLQYPMLGFWMMVPTVFVLAERLFRLGMGFYDIQATVRILDGETVEVTVVIPNHLQRSWVYKPGQYVFFQVPKISRFQWHPFTVSVCVGKKIQLLIKTDGNWTKRLRELADESGKPTDIIVGINGPFGAPAQRFYDYDHAIIVGSGIGVTPFSGILSDLQARDDALHAGPGPGSPLDKMNSWNGFGSSMADSERLPPVDENEKAAGQNDRRRRQTEGNLYTEAAAMRRGSTLSGKKPAPEYRRVDFHWTVRERNYLLWMSELLNNPPTSISQQQMPLDPEDLDTLPNLDIRIHTHVTGILSKSRSIATHIYAWLLETHRTAEHPASPLTGLLNPTQFGRPDFVTILDNHYQDMVRLRARDMRKRELEREAKERERQRRILRIGVFYCGTPAVGSILADRCRALTARGHAEGTGIEYHFLTEVFG
ncbi:NADPH oxidase [Rhypophila decipiens]|uniref:NADPH oxidase n=1 Tax=Rhypophila decipiens TaxID=261697 RepID=A0AAN7B8Q7_9PEZI|nr:NADPH oxidase [Rhypophila decipiens]